MGLSGLISSRSTMVPALGNMKLVLIFPSLPMLHQAAMSLINGWQPLEQLPTQTAVVLIFTMPASATTVTASYKVDPAKTLAEAKEAKIAAINAVDDGLNSSDYTAASWQALQSAISSAIAQVNAATTGKVFDKWMTTDGVTFADPNAASTSFTMPATNVTVIATYKDAKKYIFSTKYEATLLNWILFFLCFGFIWMWF